MSLMKGKKGLIMGVANERSIAWGISQKLAEAGAELAFTYLGDALKKRVIPLAEKLNSKVTLSCDVEKKEEIVKLFEEIRNQRTMVLGEKDSKEIEKRIFLQTIDMNWTSHIQYLEQLRQVIGLRSYGQRDPLIEYKKEAFELFENLLNKLKVDYLTILMNLKVINKNENQNNLGGETSIANDPKCLLILKKNSKISRNERCEATGKKFKNCCGAL